VLGDGTAIITWGPGGTSETGTPNSYPADTESSTSKYH